MLKSSRKGDLLSVYLSGEIDHCAASGLRSEIEALIEERETKRLHFDFSQVSFIDSSGIGMIIGRYKTMTERGGCVSAGEMSAEVNRLFRMAGLHRIIPVVKHGGTHDE